MSQPTKNEEDQCSNTGSLPDWGCLFTDDVVLMYYSKSKDAKPGKGTGEQLVLSAGDSTTTFKNGDLEALSQIPDWRKRLSNFDESPFELDGYRWRSVEHFFQARKFVQKAPWHYRSFAMDSNSKLSRDLGGPVKKAGGKSVVELNQSERATWEKVKHSEMKRALYAKYSQHEGLCRLLLATGNAKLTHKPSRCKFTFVEYGLMQVRRRLREEKVFGKKRNGGGSGKSEKEDVIKEDLTVALTGKQTKNEASDVASISATAENTAKKKAPPDDVASGASSVPRKRGRPETDDVSPALLVARKPADTAVAMMRANEPAKKPKKLLSSLIGGKLDSKK